MLRVVFSWKQICEFANLKTAVFYTFEDSKSYRGGNHSFRICTQIADCAGLHTLFFLHFEVLSCFSNVLGLSVDESGLAVWNFDQFRPISTGAKIWQLEKFCSHIALVIAPSGSEQGRALLTMQADQRDGCQASYLPLQTNPLYWEKVKDNRRHLKMEVLKKQQKLWVDLNTQYMLLVDQLCQRWATSWDLVLILSVSTSGGAMWEITAVAYGLRVMVQRFLWCGTLEL